MARLWSSGFELNSTTSGVEWTAAVDDGVVGTIQGTTVRSGSYAMQVTSLSSGAAKGLQYTFNSGDLTAERFIRFYFRYATLPSADNAIFAVKSGGGSNIAAIKLSSTGTLKLFNATTQVGSASSSLSADTWYRIEFRYDASGAAGTHVLAARIDGTQFATTSAATLTGIANMQLGGNIYLEAQTTGNFYFDDVAVNDNTGSFQNSYPGAGSIIHIRPNAAGDNTNWSRGGTDSGANWSQVDENPPNDSTDRVQDTVLNEIDDYNLAAPATTFDSVTLVQAGVRFAYTGATNHPQFVVRLKSASSGTVEESSAIDPASTSYSTNAPSTPKNYPLTLYDLPGASTEAWGNTTLGTAQLGIRISTGGSTNLGTVSALWLLVEGIPFSGNIETTPAPVTATFSVPSPTVSSVVEYTVTPDPVVATFTIPGVTASAQGVTVERGEASVSSTLADNPQKRYLFLVETSGGETKGVTEKWDFDAIVREINGSMTATLTTNERLDTFRDGKTEPNNNVTIRIATPNTDATGLDYYTGYIVSRDLVISGQEERIKVRTFGHISKLYRSIWRTSTTITHNYQAGDTTTNILQDIIDHYRVIDTNWPINYTATSMETGSTIQDKFESITFGQALEKVASREFTSGQIWYWRALGDNVFTFKKASTGPDHSLIMGKDITNLNLTEDLINAVNEVFVYYNNNTIQRKVDSTSTSQYSYLSELIRESNVTNATTAEAIADAILEGRLPELLKITVTVNDNYSEGIEFIDPGDTVEILNLPTVVDDLLTSNMLVTKTTYRKDEVDLELTIKHPRLDASLENLRRQFTESRTEGSPTTFSDFA